MNTLHQILSILLLAIFAFSCSEESSDPVPENAETVQLKKLAQTWEPITVMKDDENVTGRFNGFTITFTQQKTYATTPDQGGYDVDPFQANGTWDFKGDNLNIISRDDGVDMNLSVTETKLTLQFQIANPNGRVLGIGEYNFELAPK